MKDFGRLYSQIWLKIMKYDYLIVGSGMFGATFARMAMDNGQTCLIIDKRNHIAGNCYTEKIENIDVHMYGPHIFHTSSHKVWNFVNRFSEFNNFINSPKAISNGKLYSLPFNMNTFYELWGVTKPSEAKKIIDSQKLYTDPKNLEEQAISLVGTDIYETLIKYYTKKQWGKDPRELPAFIISRLPVRFNFDNNYFNDIYQGIPKNGYTNMIENMIDGSDVILNTDYFNSINEFNSIADKVIYTGKIDEYFEYKHGVLEYRSLKFEHKILNEKNHQGNAVINYCDNSTDYTRIVEHKFFNYIDTDKTVITYEYPSSSRLDSIPYYPVNNLVNNNIYELYKHESKSLDNIIFGGRLAEYKYMDMHVVIASAIKSYKDMIGEK